MITHVSIPTCFLSDDRPRATASATSRPAPNRVEATQKSTEPQRQPHRGPSAPFLAQLLGQRDDGIRQDAQIGRIQGYPDHSGADVFGPGVDILPMNFRLIDLRV